MCATCGCSTETEITITNLQTGSHLHMSPDGEARPHDHGDSHGPGHSHAHTHTRGEGKMLRLEQEILQRNDLLAARNRGWLEGRGILALNLMSSPGAGKTTLLEKTIGAMGKELGIRVIEGDQETAQDGERIRAAGASVVQVNTGVACHLDAAMIGHALRELDAPGRSVVLIENVGNLVCPAMFDLGEKARVVVASVTEGEDKPAKYPHMFRSADVIVLNKVDLLPYVTFSVKTFEEAARALNPRVKIFHVSATRGDGMEVWLEWLRKEALG